MSDFLDLNQRYETILLVNAGLGLAIGLLTLGAFISCLHMRTRRNIIRELKTKTDNIDPLHSLEDDRIMNSPRVPRYHVNKDPEAQYMEMSGRSRSSSYPYFNRVNPVTSSFRLPAILQNSNSRKLL